MLTRDRTIEELKILYNSLRQKEGERCVYCGLFATDKEHVIPQCWIKELEDLKVMGFDVEIPKEVIVPSCRECNLIASGKIFKNFRAKKAYIQEQLKKRYAKFCRFKLWKDEEINELTGRLKEQVYFFNEIAKTMKQRLERLK